MFVVVRFHLITNPKLIFDYLVVYQFEIICTKLLYFCSAKTAMDEQSPQNRDIPCEPCVSIAYLAIVLLA
jgi:hypothetical protein